ncbi:hypothetical protein ABIE26_000223 [Pedobacter africanus]
MYLKIYSLLLFFGLIPFLDVNAQTNGITPLHKFMQVNADTTILLEHASGWIGPPQYWILSKKGDTTTAYIYDLPHKADALVPNAIRKAIQKASGFDPLRKIEVNQFFRPVAMPGRLKGKAWAILMAERPWSISDDKVDGRGCPPKKDRSVILDGGTTNLYLITKGEIKKLSFYAPAFYEEQCPGRKGRQSILRIEKFFSDLFKEESR